MQRKNDKQIFHSVLLILIACLLVADAHGNNIIGVPLGYVPATAPLVTINPATGSYTVLNTAGNSYNSLAQNSQGQLFASFFSGSSSNGRIARIDPTTGAPVQVFNAVTPGAGTIRGLAFDLNDRLLAVVNRDDASGSPTLNDDLYELNLANQTTQLIGSLGYMSVQGLDVAPSGDLFAWDITAGLLKVNPLTGLATDVNLRVNGTAGIQSIVFAPDGRLFGAGFGLFMIDPVTGVYSAIGATSGIDVRGIEWMVPEPAGLALLLGPLALVFFIRTNSL
jgi:hypothetical protein